MKINKSARTRMATYFAASCLLYLQIGCSSYLFRIGPDVGEYNSHGTSFKRSEVISELGQPDSTETFQPPRSVAQLTAQKHPAFWQSINNSPGSVSSIDTYVIRGPIENIKDGNAAGGFAIVTLGLSEIVVLPAAIVEVVRQVDDVHYLYMAYSSSEILIARTLYMAKE